MMGSSFTFIAFVHWGPFSFCCFRLSTAFCLFALLFTSSLFGLPLNSFCLFNPSLSLSLFSFSSSLEALPDWFLFCTFLYLFRGQFPDAPDCLHFSLKVVVLTSCPCSVLYCWCFICIMMPPDKRNLEYSSGVTMRQFHELSFKWFIPSLHLTSPSGPISVSVYIYNSMQYALATVKVLP